MDADEDGDHNDPPVADDELRKRQQHLLKCHLYSAVFIRSIETIAFLQYTFPC